jgi:hypothetical protein
MNSEQDPAGALRNIYQVRGGTGSTLPVSAHLSAGAFQDRTYLTSGYYRNRPLPKKPAPVLGTLPIRVTEDTSDNWLI